MNAGRFPCPQCGGLFQVDQTTASGQVRCPHCQQVVEMSSPPAASSTKPPPPPPPPPVSASPPSVPVDVPERSLDASILPEAIDGTKGVAAGEVQGLAERSPAMGISLEEPVKTAGRGRTAVELIQRSSEERARRRRTKNIWFWLFCVAIILVTLALLVA